MTTVKALAEKTYAGNLYIRFVVCLVAFAAMLLEVRALTHVEGGITWTYGVYDSSWAMIYNSGNAAISPSSYVGALTIPAMVSRGRGNSITTYPVRRLGPYALAGCLGVTSLTVPGGVQTIGSYACSGCAGLASVSLPTSLTRIEAAAFKDCTALASVTIPEGVTAVEGAAFAGCTSLASVILPSTLVLVASNAFEGCTSLKEIVFTTPASRQVTIGNKAFKDCTELERVVLSENVEFSFSAFIQLPGPLSSDYMTDAFAGCSAIRDVTISVPLRIRQGSGGTADIVRIGSVFTGVYESVTNVTVRNGDELVANMFNQCSNLQSVVVSAGVTNVGKYAFYGCSSLRSVSLPDTVGSINDSAFMSCTSLESAHLGTGLRSISTELFRGCSSLAEFTMPPNVTSIGNYAFSGCSSLAAIAIPPGVTGIGRNAFDGCARLASVSLPDGLASIGQAAFRNCGALTGFSIPNSVTSVGIDCLSGALSLRRLVVGDGVSGTLEYNIFENLPSIESVVIGNGVTAIDEWVFYFMGRSTLRSVRLGTNVVRIASSAFRNCNALETLYLPSRLKDAGRPDGVPADAVIIYYDDESVLSGSSTATTPVPVPHEWLDRWTALLAASGGDYETFGNASAANGRAVWECYVLGLNPENGDATNEFRIVSLPMKADGTLDLGKFAFEPPQTHWNVLGARAVVKGAATLDAEFVPVTEQNKSSFRFFKVEVELPQPCSVTDAELSHIK